ncbi:hypothetical protein [Sulfuricurvum sp.]|jgi:hypothetical protein|uniref:hypothetical protein n=3 Tax=Sulfuricurvum sp. TaxID=2025608 RepID=UPI002631D69E|nr:hypothetical protein [Sulfuricurvum sp.]MDD2839467.1 hypothetical protein [Sulfuricurvum sp.]MDD4884888.1 hypothetical protein [Sulfuricurvum sp.]
MKKIYSLIAAAIMIAFCGCAGTTPAAEAGVAVEKEVATYKIAAYSDVEAAKSKLTGAGFEVVGTYKGDSGTTVLFTNAAMKSMANKPNRGLAAVGRLLVDDENKQISIANPIYFGKAFMQKEYNHATAASALASLEKAFGPLKNSTDKWEFDGLAGYHFMVGMPYYEDMMVVAEGSTADLVAKAQKAKGTTAVVKLGDDRYVAFVSLDRRTNGFVKKVGAQNGEILPWAVLIEDGKAKALSAKYFIAISYPLLTMSEFMTIATVPGAVEKDLQKVFK